MKQLRDDCEANIHRLEKDVETQLSIREKEDERRFEKLKEEVESFTKRQHRDTEINKEKIVETKTQIKKTEVAVEKTEKKVSKLEKDRNKMKKSEKDISHLFRRIKDLETEMKEDKQKIRDLQEDVDWLVARNRKAECDQGSLQKNF